MRSPFKFQPRRSLRSSTRIRRRSGVSVIPMGRPAQFLVDVFHSGECEATGTTVSFALAPGQDYLSADSEQGTWAYDSSANTVTFSVGHLGKASRTELSVLVVPAV